MAVGWCSRSGQVSMPTTSIWGRSLLSGLRCHQRFEKMNSTNITAVSNGLRRRRQEPNSSFLGQIIDHCVNKTYSNWIAARRRASGRLGQPEIRHDQAIGCQHLRKFHDRTRKPAVRAINQVDMYVCKPYSSVLEEQTTSLRSFAIDQD